MSFDSLCFLLHLATVLLMTGLIWVIQWVHYPLFAYAEKTNFVRFEQAHTARITLIVLPLMVLELFSAFALVWRPPLFMSLFEVYVTACLTVGTWAATFFLSVPEHQKLAQGFDLHAHRRLVKTNGVRTVCWTANAFLLLVIVHRILFEFSLNIHLTNS